MNFDYTDTQAQIRAAVKDLCARFGPEYWRQLAQEGKYPEAFVDAMAEAGWLAALIPEEYGGAGLPLLDACLILQEVNQNGGSAVHCHAQMYTMASIMRHGSEAQKRRTLPRIADGSLRLQAFGVTEPDAGSNTLAIKTFARRVPGGYVVNGQKIWTSRYSHSHMYLLIARTTPLGDVKK
ncbi:MAG: acyl-CoA/acyl-ACP dehydrogenase, partial [Rubrivivax sp.]|nr:acyl-CoA/acyl-ACP dehydrogenase [Rubrivivax sp.]